METPMSSTSLRLLAASMKRLLLTLAALTLGAPGIASAQSVGGPISIIVNSYANGNGQTIQLQDLSVRTVSIDANSQASLYFTNATGTDFSDFHFDVPEPTGTLGDFVWEDVSSSDFSSNVFSEIQFRFVNDHLLVDMFRGASSGILAGASFEVSIYNNLSVGDFESIAYNPTVPAPSTLALLGIGLAGLGFARRRKAQ